MTSRADRFTETSREVGFRQVTAGNARTAVIRRPYAAPIQDVWNACTKPDRLNRWFLPLSGDLREGGTFSLEGNASGDILHCEPPHRLEVTWVYGDRPVDEVVLLLSPGDNGDTVLELVHATVTGEVEWEGQLVDVLPDVGAGWELPLTYLAKYLRDELPDAPAAEWYTPSSDDEALMVRSGQAWTALIEATGTDERNITPGNGGGRAT